MLCAVAAVDNNNGIGKNGQLLFTIKDDLKRFKEITTGHTIIMGRKTFETLPYVLPNRKHIVLTTNTDFKVNNENVTVVHKLNNIIEKYKGIEEDAYIIGGETIYKQTLKFCQKIYLTKIDAVFSADTFFPAFNTDNYKIQFESETFTDKLTSVKFKYIIYILK